MDATGEPIGISHPRLTQSSKHVVRRRGIGGIGLAAEAPQWSPLESRWSLSEAAIFNRWDIPKLNGLLTWENDQQMEGFQ